MPEFRGHPLAYAFFNVVDISRAKGVRPLWAEVSGTFAESRGSGPFECRCQAV